MRNKKTVQESEGSPAAVAVGTSSLWWKGFVDRISRVEGVMDDESSENESDEC